jgi:hypothetical protein
MKRHKRTFRAVKTRAKAWARKAAQGRAEMKGFFELYKQTKEKNNIYPDNEWNGDESGYRVGVLDKSEYVWTFAEIHAVESTDPEVRQLVTVMEAISAAGRTIPPFVILPGVDIKVAHVANDLCNGTAIATSPNGYTDDQLALDWFDHFEAHTRPLDSTESRLLLLDNHGSHCTIEFHQRCLNANVVLFLLPPHSTHLVQPLDVGVFQVCKHYHQKDIRKRLAYGGVDYGKLDFLNGLFSIRAKAMKSSTIESSWEKAGLVPYNPSLVLDNMPDPITSATNGNHFITEKKGYIGTSSEQAAGWEDEKTRQLRLEARQQEDDDIATGLIDEEDRRLSLRTPPRPKTPYDNWSKVVTPPLNLGVIRHYDEYVNNRISQLITRGDLSPTIAHVAQKRDKAREALCLLAVQDAERKRVSVKTFLLCWYRAND